MVAASRSFLLTVLISLAACEYAPCIWTDGLTLFFTHAQKGMLAGAAIFMAKRSSVTAPFDDPVRLAAIDGFVEGPTLSPDERSLYFHRKDGGYQATSYTVAYDAGAKEYRIALSGLVSR